MASGFFDEAALRHTRNGFRPSPPALIPPVPGVQERNSFYELHHQKHNHGYFTRHWKAPDIFYLNWHRGTIYFRVATRYTILKVHLKYTRNNASFQ